jgi:hypothetical protein
MQHLAHLLQIGGNVIIYIYTDMYNISARSTIQYRAFRKFCVQILSRVEQKYSLLKNLILTLGFIFLNIIQIFHVIVVNIQEYFPKVP